MAAVQIAADLLHSHMLLCPVRELAAFCIQLEDQPDCISLLRYDLQSIAFVIGDLDLSVAVGGPCRDISAFRCGSSPSPLETAVDGLVFTPGHEQSEFKILFIKLIIRVVSL